MLAETVGWESWAFLTQATCQIVKQIICFARLSKSVSQEKLALKILTKDDIIGPAHLAPNLPKLITDVVAASCGG